MKIVKMVKRCQQVILMMFCSCFAIQSCSVTPSPKTFKPLISDDAGAKEVLEVIRKKYNQPAMAVALIFDDIVIAKAASGTLVYRGDTDVTTKHRFHIGSTTKPFTSLLIALFVKEGRLRYDMPLEEALPDTPMNPEYKTVTLTDLMLSRAGIIPFQQTHFEKPETNQMLWDTIPSKSDNAWEQRDLVTKYALSQKPINTPRTSMVYSNVSWAIVGNILETIAGKSYEDLVRDKIFIPLGMKDSRLGAWPASPTDSDQPRGHFVDISGPKPQALDDPYIFPAWMNPAGGIHCSIEDYTRFAREVLLGLQGKGRLLLKEEYEIIHSIQAKEKISVMYQGITQEGESTLGYGWAVVPFGDGNLSAADGSGGTFYARLAILPEYNLAFAGFTNAGDGERALSEAIRQLTGLDWN